MEKFGAVKDFVNLNKKVLHINFQHYKMADINVAEEETTDENWNTHYLQMGLQPGEAHRASTGCDH